MSNSGFEAFLERACGEEMARFAAERVDDDPVAIRELIATYANEARVGWELVRDIVQPGMQVLDVGAGIGVLAAWLHSLGAAVTAIEPAGEGFDRNFRVGEAIKIWFQLDGFRYQDRRVEDLRAGHDGPFDLIYSVNVVEHLPNPEIAMERMAAVLAPGGCMVHTCPNYSVPYEPHFALPLLPFAPAATRWLLPKRIVDSGLWRSLNFVTASRIRRAAQASGLRLTLERGTMYKSFARLDEDPMFAARQGAAIRFLHRTLNLTGLMHVIRHWPPRLATPMTFRCRHQVEGN